MNTHHLPIGVDDFKRYRDINGYLVDKTLLIREVLDGSHALLLPRPRRFGKTMNLSMLRYFFDQDGADTGYLFEDLAIANDSDAMSHRAAYPVVYLTLKDVSGGSWSEAREKLCETISREYVRHGEVEQSLRTKMEKGSFQELVDGEASDAALKSSLKNLIIYLHRHYKKPVVVLVDEYDSPVIEAYDKGYYDPMIDFMRAWLGGGLKHERGGAVFRSVVTGIMRVARESIFSGLNNLKVHSLLSRGPFSDKFGFTEQETEQVLEDFDLRGQMGEVCEWYNGYKFGDRVIYNPWSVLNYVVDYPDPAGPKWLNTSSDALVHAEMNAGGVELKRDLEALLAGEELRYPINENIRFAEVTRNRQNIWSFLTFSGYLRAEDPQRDPITDSLAYRVSIPNREVREVYKSFVRNWYEDLEFQETDELLRSLVGEEYEEFDRLLNKLMRGLLSYHDGARYPEVAYHAFFLGLLANLRAIYEIRSNAESGYGRADIILRPKTEDYPHGYVIEFKAIDDADRMDAEVQEAFDQIADRDYAHQLKESGVRKEDLRLMAVVVAGKKVEVQCRVDGSLPC